MVENIRNGSGTPRSLSVVVGFDKRMKVPRRVHIVLGGFSLNTNDTA